MRFEEEVRYKFYSLNGNLQQEHWAFSRAIYYPIKNASGKRGTALRDPIPSPFEKGGYRGIWFAEQAFPHLYLPV